MATKAESAKRDKRVIEVAQMLAEEKWKGGETERELCKRWNLSPTSIRTIRAEATRYLRMATMGTIEEIRDRILGRADFLFGKAIESFQLDKNGQQHPWADVKAATQVLKLQAQLTGALVHRHEYSEVEAAKSKYENMSEEELREEARRLADGREAEGNGKAGVVH